MNRWITRWMAGFSALTATLPLVMGALGVTATIILPSRIVMAAPIFQDDEAVVEPIKTSRVSGLPLPAGAHRLLKQDAVDELTKGMRATAEEGGLELGKVEGIIWGGKDHSAARNAQLEKDLVASFKKGNFQFEKIGDKTQDGLKMTLFIAGKSDSKVAILGFYAPHEQGFLLGMARIAKKGELNDEPAANNAAADEPSAPAKPVVSGKKLPPAEQKKVDAATAKAIEDRDAAQVKALIAKGANPNGRSGKQSFLMRAVIGGNVEMVSALLEAGADPDYGDGASIAPLFTAALVNELEILDLLLEKGADPNAQLQDNGFTPLHGAAINGNSEAIEKLLAKGADANIKDKSNRKASAVAAASKHTAAVNLLKEAEQKGEGG